MNKKHGNTGKRNAAGDVELDSFLHARVNKGQKARWVSYAKNKNMKLTEWVILTLNKAVDDD